jgi:hypothetical protein
VLFIKYETSRFEEILLLERLGLLNMLRHIIIVTDWAVARRRIGKHVPNNPHPTIEGRPLLGNRPVNIHHNNDYATETVFYGVRAEELS